ncbi:MAG: hypothetical protein GPJ54_14365 [Candidatus Heimdallarchaeota archaeon]|nr:hypothetical protein [Candidatus Heimdallarchaeota archaeon]
MKINSLSLILCFGLLITPHTSLASTTSSLTWNYGSISEEFGSQIFWDVQGYFEPDENTLSTWTTVALITTTNTDGETITYEETGTGISTNYPDHEFAIEINSDALLPQYDQFFDNETNLNDHFSVAYDNNEILLNIDEIIVFIFPTIIDNNSKQVNLFSSEANLLEYQESIRSLLGLSQNSSFQYEQGTYAPIVIRDINDQIYRYHSSGVLTDYLLKNSTHNIRIDLDNRYFVVDDVASDFPLSSFVIFGFILVIFRRHIRE